MESRAGPPELDRHLAEVGERGAGRGGGALRSQCEAFLENGILIKRALVGAQSVHTADSSVCRVD